MRIHKDGNGVERHLHGLRHALPDPRRILRLAPQSGVFSEAPADCPLYDKIPIYDQGQVGKCTAMVQAKISSALVLHLTGKLVEFSTDFGYAMSRMDEGTPLTEDSGCAIPDVQKTWQQWGACPKDSWDTQDFTAQPPPAACNAALDYRGKLYFHCPDHVTIHSQLALGFGVSIGISVPESMMSSQCASDGIVHLPEPGEQILGGHDICLRGYDPKKLIDGALGAYVFVNSWGDWGATVAGRRGHGYLPKAYVSLGYATDAECPRDIMTGPTH